MSPSQARISTHRSRVDINNFQATVYEAKDIVWLSEAIIPSFKNALWSHWAFGRNRIQFLLLLHLVLSLCFCYSLLVALSCLFKQGKA